MLRLTHRMRLPTREFASLEAALAHFVSGVPQAPDSACFAVAGPLGEGLFHFTNLDWSFDPAALSQAFSWRAFHLVNDFAAMARGAVETPDENRSVIAPGVSQKGAPVVALGPGTGLGLATLVPTQAGQRVLSSEGGHVAFAPQTEIERRVWETLNAMLGYVSVESVASGTGLELVYRALGGGEVNLTARDIAARAPIDATAKAALGVFFSALGVFAGNAVLTTGARGGVLLCGGMLPALEQELRASDFLSRLHERGIMSAYLADVPVTLIKDEDAALRGAALLFAEREA